MRTIRELGFGFCFMAVLFLLSMARAFTSPNGDDGGWYWIAFLVLGCGWAVQRHFRSKP